MNSAGLTQFAVEANGFRFNTYFKPDVDNEGYLVFHHGVGSSAATFAMLLESLDNINPKLGFLVYDCRHHGLTESLNPAEIPYEIEDLDLETLCSDLSAVMAQRLLQPPSPSESPSASKPSVILVGHSMGGSVMAKFANSKPEQYDVRGLVVIDACEGYATDSLASMHSLLGIWPKSFNSINDAIKWHVYQGAQLRNKASAKVSVPPLLVQDPETHQYSWKLDLKRTSRNWEKWFKGLDEMFINAPCARLLILSGVRKLDTDLTRAQMQGKFQMVVITEAGHYIHEDSPMRVAYALNDFWSRSFITKKIVPKFGQFRTD